MALPVSYSGGAGGAAGPATATSTSGFNNSGFNVDFGSGGIDTAPAWIKYAAIGVVAYVLWRSLKRGR